MTKRLPVVVLLLVALLTGGSLSAQDTLSQQVLRLLVRDNEWTGVQTFDRAVGLTLEEGVIPPSTTDDRLYNVGGNLFFNGVLVAPSAGVGTVTSVGLSLPAIIAVTGSPVTSAGTLTGTLATQVANRVWAGPTTGADAAPTFRALVAADLPAIPVGSLTGTVAVANGGTGLTSGTSGGVLAYTASGTLASSAALAANQLVLGGGAGVVPVTLGSLGTTSTVLHGNAAGVPSFAAVNLTTTVTGTLPVTNGGLGIATGTSGGIPYFSAATTIASSAALTANRIVLGGGAGVSPTVLGSLGTTTTVLHGNAGGAPTFGPVSLTADVTGTLPVANGGSGATTLTGLLRGNGTSAFTVIATSSTVGQVLRVTGADTYAWGAVNLADTDAITGTLPAGNGGTSVTSTPTNGQLLIGNGTGYTLATLTGTANQLVVTGGAGSITLSTPQAIATASTPQFARLGLGTGAGGTAVITTTGQFDLGLFDNGNCGAADTVSWNAGQIQSSTLSAATCTYTFSNPIAGATYRLAVIQDATGGRVVVWPATVTWMSGSVPTLSAAAGTTTLCRFTYVGAVYYGDCDTSVSGIGTAIFTLSNAQILTLPTAAVTIATAPGTGSRYQIIGVDLRTAITGAYTNVDTGAFLYAGWTGAQGTASITNEGALTSLDAFLTDAASTAWLGPKQLTGVTNPHAVVYNSAFLNTALVIQANNVAAGNFTGGNAANSITGTVYYVVR